MTQPYSTRRHRVAMLIALLVLILVIGKTVAAGTSYSLVKKVPAEEKCEKVQDTMIKRMVSDIGDMPWQPLLTFFR